jgi:cobalamin biosynthesis Mg chelatase CobN
VEPKGTASDATPTDGSGTGGKLGDADASSGKQGHQKQRTSNDTGENDKGDSGLEGSANSGLEEVESSTASDSGSSGIGVVLPIILGALVLGAIVFVVVRRRRRVQTGGA